MFSTLAASAAVAASVAAAPGGFGISISPAIVTGPASSHATYIVDDAGTTPLTVRVQAVEEVPVKGGGWTYYGEFDAAVVNPERFTLLPGQTRQVKVTVHSTDGYAHHVAVAAAAVPPQVKSGAAVSPSVAGIYRIPGKPNPLYAHPRSVPQPQPPAAGVPWGPIGVGVLLALILAALVQAGRKLKISRR